VPHDDVYTLYVKIIAFKKFICNEKKLQKSDKPDDNMYTMHV
jgi:hypothetical protein